MQSPDAIAVMKDCKEQSLAGTMTFPDVVARLRGAGVERYHVDYSRDEITYYFPCGGSHVLPMGLPRDPIAVEFDAAAVAAAVRGAQLGELVYPEFSRNVMAAGCVGYFAQLAGRRVLYFGRDGESHVEHFPPGNS